MVRRWRGRPPGRVPADRDRGRARRGDEIELLSRPEHGITVALVSDAILLDESLRARAGSAPELAESLAVHLREDAA
jgi:MOSC domain-containing protein YiiM